MGRIFNVHSFCTYLLNAYDVILCKGQYNHLEYNKIILALKELTL